MKFSEYWLREWINPEINTKKLAEQITMSGFEVNNITPVASNFKNVVIGCLKSYKRNSKYNHLYDIYVDIGKKNLLNITSTLKHFYIGMRVIVAETSTFLYKKNSTIEKKNFYNNNTKCKLLSLAELGIVYNDNKECVRLPDDAPIGKEIKDYLKLEDNIIDINVTPNRPDCLSILGISREIAARNCLHINIPKIQSINPTIPDIVPVYVQKSKFCPNYFCRIINGVTTNINTPLWIKEKLRRCGIVSKNIVIDIINYVLIEIGQPIYIFDKDKIDKNIIIRLANKNENITVLNEKKIILSSKTLIISDQSKGLDLAGITDSNIKQINAKTKNIFLGCFYFHPSLIAGKSNKYELFTEIAYRYERGIDPKMQFFAIEYVTKLIVDICGGEVGPIIKKQNMDFLNTHFLVLRKKTLNRIVGYTISNKIVTNTLCRLGFHVNKIMDKWKIQVPTWRFDIHYEADIIEEILRIHGYNYVSNLKINFNSNKKNKYTRFIENNLLLNQIKNLLMNKGYQEIITYSFVNHNLQKLLFPKIDPITLSNPFSKNVSVMRVSLLSGLLQTVVYNKCRQQKRIRLFESGMCFSKNKKFKLGIQQKNMLSGVLYGPRFNKNWNSSSCPADFYDLKGDIETIFDYIGQTENISFVKKKHASLHPGQSSAIYLKNKIIGFIGMIHPDIEKYLNLNYHTMVFEISCKDLYKMQDKKIADISKFPINSRDISIIVPTEIPSSKIISVCKKVVSANQFVDISIIDVYHGNEIKQGYKSITINLEIQGTLCTLNEEEISETVKKYIHNLEKHFHVTLK